MERIGLIAGSGNFPLVFAKEARRKGVRLIAFAIKGLTFPQFNRFVDRIHWVDPSKFKLQQFVMLLLAERIKKIVMVGKIDKALLYSPLKNNKDIASVLKDIKDNRDYSILEEVTKRLDKIGIKLIDGLDYLKDLLPQKGVLTKRHPNEGELEDIEFGMPIAKELARLDVGQTITVKDRAIITVEAMEGTDETIRRAGDIAKGDFIVIKVARPKQDMRWDVPLVGVNTIVTMIKAKARSLAIESEKMFLAEKTKVIKEADLNGIAIVAF